MLYLTKQTDKCGLKVRDMNVNYMHIMYLLTHLSIRVSIIYLQ